MQLLLLDWQVSVQGYWPYRPDFIHTCHPAWPFSAKSGILTGKGNSCVIPKINCFTFLLFTVKIS